MISKTVFFKVYLQLLRGHYYKWMMNFFNILHELHWILSNVQVVGLVAL